MSGCEFFSYVVPDGPPFYANGPVHAVTICKTHNWHFDGPVQGDLCPLGRIEQATEEAIDKIKDIYLSVGERDA